MTRDVAGVEGDAELRDLYRDVLLDYYRSPSRKGRIEAPDVESRGVNPLCGDEVELTATCRERNFVRIRYGGHGCVISQASAAMMAEALEGRALERAGELIEAFRTFLLDGASAAALPAELCEARALEGVRRFPARVKCALLPWNAMRLGLEHALSGKTRADYQESE